MTEVESAINLAAEAQPSRPEFRTLDARVIKLWRVTGLIGCSPLLLVLLTGLLFGVFAEPALVPWIFLGWVGLVAVCAWLVYFRPPRVYRAWSYRIDDKVLETRSGLMFRVNRLLPLTRLQHVDLHSGPLERSFGLASLVLHTAGTHDASIRIPGLDAGDARRLRDHLVEIGGDDAV